MVIYESDIEAALATDLSWLEYSLPIQGPEEDAPRRVFQQFRLPCGVIDLLIETPRYYIVAEIKRERFKPADVGQLAKYVGYMQSALYLDSRGAGHGAPIIPVAIAPITDDATIWALSAMGATFLRLEIMGLDPLEVFVDPSYEVDFFNAQDDTPNNSTTIRDLVGAESVFRPRCNRCTA